MPSWARSRQNKIETAAEGWALFEVLFPARDLVLFHRINTAAVALFTPLLTRIIANGVKDGTFKTFDPEGVADMLLQLGAATHGIVARAIAGDSEAEWNAAIRALERRIKLYEIALDRILGLPDGSIRLTERGYVRAVMTARRQASTSPRSKRTRRAKLPGIHEPGRIPPQSDTIFRRALPPDIERSTVPLFKRPPLTAARR